MLSLTLSTVRSEMFDFKLFARKWLTLVLLGQIEMLVNCEKVFLPLCSETKVEDTLCSLVENYDHLSPPQYPTEIFSNLDIKAIQDIDESKHTITFLVDFYIHWSDQRLSYTNNTGKMSQSPMKKINHLKHLIWIPEFYFPKNYQVRKIEGLKEHIQIIMYHSFNGSHHIGLSDELMITFECKMSFASFPFDHQTCEWIYRPSDLVSAQAILMPPTLFTGDSYTKYLSQGQVVHLNNHGLQFEASVQVKEPVLVPGLEGDNVFTENNLVFSYSGVEFSLSRNTNEMNKLLISYYFPSGAFAILSLFSFFINHHVVPGRMGMLVTIFLVVTTIYGGVKAPPGRGFSYIEQWYIGVQIPILFALLEYGVILAINKYKKLPANAKKSSKSKRSADGLQETFKMADFIAFCCSFVFIVIFNSVYLYLCLQA